jgi:hypothetical protein
MKAEVKAFPSSAARSIASSFRVTKPVYDLKSALSEAQSSPLNMAPFDWTELFFVEEQLSIIPQVMWPKPRTSRLFAYLTERPEDTHLVVDAFKTGKDSLYVCRLADSDVVTRWLSRMVQPTLIINHAEGDTIIAAPAKVFIA